MLEQTQLDELPITHLGHKAEQWDVMLILSWTKHLSTEINWKLKQGMQQPVFLNAVVYQLLEIDWYVVTHLYFS